MSDNSIAASIEPVMPHLLKPLATYISGVFLEYLPIYGISSRLMQSCVAHRYFILQSGSAANMALVTLLGFLPTLLLSVPAGVLADRHDRRLLMMIGDGFSALGILFILICMINGEAALWQICTGVFISSSFSALLEPSYRATVTDLLTKEQYSKASGMVSHTGIEKVKPNFSLLPLSCRKPFIHAGLRRFINFTVLRYSGLF